MIEYRYDAWGKPLETTGSLTTTLGYLNPFRYRGYVYDEETGLYYLRSRYYNPEWGRFLNSDLFIGMQNRLLTHNLFAYGENRPLIYKDPQGTFVMPIITSPNTLPSLNDAINNYESQKEEHDPDLQDELSADGLVVGGLSILGPPNGYDCYYTGKGDFCERWFDADG